MRISVHFFLVNAIRLAFGVISDVLLTNKNIKFFKVFAQSSNETPNILHFH